MAEYFRLSGHDVNVDFYEHAPSCPDCRAVYDSRWIGPLTTTPKNDYSYTLDGALVVSARVADFATKAGGATTLELPGRDDFFVLVVDQRFTVDPIASNLDRLEYCLRCDAWRGIRSVERLVVVDLPPSGFSATDVCFGFRENRPSNRCPTVIVDDVTMARLAQEGFTGLVSRPIHISPASATPHRVR